MPTLSGNIHDLGGHAGRSQEVLEMRSYRQRHSRMNHEVRAGCRLTLQTPRGEIIWRRHEDGTPDTYALLTGS